MREIIVKLPGGHVDAQGIIHREVEIIPLSGSDEELLAGSQNSESASLVTLVLSRCVRRIGTISPVSGQLIRNLLVADRQYLLLKLREATFGERIYANPFCPWPDCGKRMSIDFSIYDIPVIDSADKGPIFTMDLSSDAVFIDENEERFTEVSFRLPNGEDQETISPMLAENESKAFALLLERCILRIGSINNPGREGIQKLSPLARLEIEKKMEEIGPKVELTLETSCPECERDFTVPFDIQDFIFGEFRTDLDLLYREIHYLAYHYHWGEREIMEMPREKRRRYIEVLADEIERLNNAVE
jgi:hypothetical protein